MTADERNAFCEKHKLAIDWIDGLWSVRDLQYNTLAEATHRDVAIDLAADRLAERGML